MQELNRTPDGEPVAPVFKGFQRDMPISYEHQMENLCDPVRGVPAHWMAFRTAGVVMRVHQGFRAFSLCTAACCCSQQLSRAAVHVAGHSSRLLLYSTVADGFMCCRRHTSTLCIMAWQPTSE